MKSKIKIIILLIIFGLGVFVFPLILNDNQVLASETEFQAGLQIPGRIEGGGNYFEIKDSEYLNITLKSTEEIEVILESIPRMISLDIASSTDSTSTFLTLEGLEPNKTYYKYQDSYKNGNVFFSSDGNHTFIQDLTQPHHIWLQEQKGTIFLPDDCSTYGIWDATSSTYTLTQDLTESVEITENNFTLDCNNHKITGSDTGYGIHLYQKNYIVVKNCRVNKFSFGISGWYSSENNIIENEIFDNGSGVALGGKANNNIISHNNINSNDSGIFIGGDADSNLVTDNIFSNNPSGFRIYSSYNHIITNNVFKNDGLFVESSGPNIVKDNLVNDKPLIYLENVSDYKIEDAGQVILINSNNITIENLDLSNTVVGIQLTSTNNSKIINNNISNNQDGVSLVYYSSNNLISGNNINSNRNRGIILQNYSDNNEIINSNVSYNSYGIVLSGANNNNIVKNTISSNKWEGIKLTLTPYGGVYSNNNVVANNTISGNGRGVYIGYECSYNKIYHNNFINNTIQATVYIWAGLGNRFYEDYPIGGNYWSDYKGIDEKSGENQDQPGSDGIGDVPYIIYGLDGMKIQDRYPFIKENGWEAPSNQPPTISDLGQFKSDGIVSIAEGSITTESNVVFKASVQDSDNDQVKLQIELKEFNQPFNGIDILESGFVSSGATTSITRYGLIDGQYKWRVRAIDEKGGTSDWQEFGEAENVDFEVELVPLYTQIESPYPAWEKTGEWYRKNYGTKDYECFDAKLGYSSIRSCGCAITSMVMLGRYYDIDTGIDNTSVDPATINNWLTSNKGYTDDGRLYWGKAIDYLGFINETTGKKMVRFEFNFKTDWNVPFDSFRIEDFLKYAKPIVAYSAKFSHYFIIDGKLASTYTIKDPTKYNTKTLNDNEDPLNKIRDYNNHFDTANLFTYLETPKPIKASIYLSIASPAELLITDPLGLKLGKDPITNTSYNEIPDGNYSIEGPIISSETPLDTFHEIKTAYISSPIEGKYDVQVIGTDLGTYTLDLLSYSQDGQSITAIYKGDTETNDIQNFELNYSAAVGEKTELYKVVNIDIKPGSCPNSINLKSKGVTPVAVLTDEFFDAKDIVVDSVLFAGASPDKGKIEDVDADGDLDLILHFKTQSLQLTSTSTEAVLTGKLNDGTLIKGVDSVRIVGK